MTAFHVVYLFFICLIYLAILTLAVITMWKIFVKMGAPGWAAIVPFYSYWVMIERLRKPQSWFWILMLCWFIYMVVTCLMMFTAISAQSASQEPDLASMLIYIVVMLAILAVMLVYSIKLTHALSKAFGQGTGFTVGLILLPIIFYAVLAFGSYEFKPEEPKALDEKPFEDRSAEEPV